MRTVHVRIEGRVQGVGYRAFVEHNALALGLEGWVRNRRDGSVEAIFQGPDDNIDEMLGRCRVGEIDGFLDFIGELLFHLGARVQLFLTQERIISRDQLGLERAIAVHFTIEQGLGDVVVGAHGTGILMRGFFELREGLIVFEIVEVIEAAPGWHVLGSQGDGEQAHEYKDDGTAGKLHP